MNRASQIRRSLIELDELTRELREKCPWDREQDASSIAPHTIEEAYELADAIASADNNSVIDELGDMLFQIYFLSLLLEEQDVSSLAQVADHVRLKLIRRHPHVFGDAEANTAGEVLENWEKIKEGERRETGRESSQIASSLPALVYARKLLRLLDTESKPGAGRLDQLEQFLGLGNQTDKGELRYIFGKFVFEVVALSARFDIDLEFALRAYCKSLGDKT